MRKKKQKRIFVFGIQHYVQINLVKSLLANPGIGDPRRSKGDPKVIQSVPKEAETLMELIKGNPSISRAELSERLGLSERQVRKMIDMLRADGRLIREGGTTGKWIIIEY